LDGVPAAESRRRAREALNLVDMDRRRTHLPSTLSGGEQQRVAVARALVIEPALLLADEPTGNLDMARSHEIMQLISALNSEEGITVIMVTHESDMAAYARRIIHFLDGRIQSDGRSVETG
jgi:putative ABC transport system ATP-binding protein